MGTLYLVSTPIGNLEDITLRALRVLREASLIAAEDTRHTRKLLNHYEITTACVSYHEHNKLARLDRVLAALGTGDVALVSDAGTPAVSDPGFELVCACIDAGFSVAPVPGPNAPIAALVASGLSTDRFLYVGFLPRRSTERRTLFADVAPLTVSIVCFETPHRLLDALNDALATLGDRQVAVANDLTKRFELVWRGTISAAQAHFMAQPPRGEFTLVFAGYTAERASNHEQHRVHADLAKTAAPPSEQTIAERLHELRDEGQGGSAAARTVAREFGLTKGEVYQVWLSLDEPAGDVEAK